MGDGVSRNCLERLYEARCEIERLETALSSQRARVIEECARVADDTANEWRDANNALGLSVAVGIAAALRALGQQDTGGAG